MVEKITTGAALGAIQEVMDTYLAFPSEEARDAVVLWAAHTWMVKWLEVTPRLSIQSKEPGSGKTRVLEILEQLVPNPTLALSLTPATVYRLVQLAEPCPTVLFDEVDTVFGKKGSGSAYVELRSMLNSGYRQGATVPRCTGTDDVMHYPVFAPVAMAGLGKLPDTLQSRSVVIKMRKKGDDQSVKPFRIRFARRRLEEVKDMLLVWARQHGPKMESAFPELPEGVVDRDADIWEPLIAIADLAKDSDWGKRARQACVHLIAEAKKKPISVGDRLIKALSKLYADKERMLMEDIIDTLNWEDFDKRTLGRLLREYGVSAVTIRDGERVGKGYKRTDLSPLWEGSS